MNRSRTASRLPFALLAVVLLFLYPTGPAAQAQYQYPFQNPSLPVEQRIDNLLSLMTTHEKIEFLGDTLNLPRLGIHASGEIPSPPGSNSQFEGIHGLAVGGPAQWGRKSPGGPGPNGGTSTIPTTQFPQAIGLGQTWDPALLEKAAAEEGTEARYIFQSYDRGGLIIRSPNADLARDPRWGRFEESYGEDPCLVGTMAVAYVKGLQGDDPHYWLSVSLLKHFMANSNEDGRLGSSSNFDARLMREYYSVPFRMGIEQGGAGAFMASYNAVNGVPMTSNPLLRSMVMKQWGFNGLIDTDRGALKNLVTRHHAYPDIDDAAAAAVHAGINQFLDDYAAAVQGALDKHLITETDIDENLRGLFRVLIHLGLLDPPKLVPYADMRTETEPAPWDQESVKSTALQLTRESIVLLKNSGNLLPLDRSKLRSIAVLGPFANDVESDFYGGTPPFAITPLDGIRNKLGSGVLVRSSADPATAAQMAKESDAAVVVIGNNPTCGARFGVCPDPSEGKEGIDRKVIDLNPAQEKLVEDVYAANPRTVVVLVTSFPYTIGWEEDHVPAILEMSHSSEEQGTALADVLLGDYDPAGRLTTTWPSSIDQLPPMMDYNIRDGRTYMYFKSKPLYAFGFGLSYTHFRYARLHLTSHRLSKGGSITVSADVTNDGSRAGDEVVQMYVQHIGSKVKRPREELKGFERISLGVGETKKVEFQLPASELAYWDEQASRWVVEADQVRVMLGGSSADIREGETINVGQ
jgi:beta-glucosidase